MPQYCGDFAEVLHAFEVIGDDLDLRRIRETLVFKGGTALKKCFFGDYRFSEDHDFSGIANVPIAEEMERAIRGVCNRTASLPDEYADVEIVCEQYKEREPHTGGQDVIRYIA